VGARKLLSLYKPAFEPSVPLDWGQWKCQPCVEPPSAFPHIVNEQSFLLATQFFGCIGSEAEPSFLTSALTAPPHCGIESAKLWQYVPNIDPIQLLSLRAPNT
jgi:hypothetical protein